MENVSNIFIKLLILILIFTETIKMNTYNLTEGVYLSYEIWSLDISSLIMRFLTCWINSFYLLYYKSVCQRV